MESDEALKNVDLQKTADFVTGEELVASRKLNSELVPPSIGSKYSSPSEASPDVDTQDLECALNTQKNFLAQANGARICDVVQAVWNEELQCSIAPKLKGKFIHHVGRAVNGEILLSPEESLFLLESDCIQVLNNDLPMSREEAFSVMLKQKLGVEKYQIYSHLSQLGFIVLPHQKDLKNQNQKPNSVSKKRKKTCPSSEKSNKRTTFSGALSDECDITKETPEDTRRVFENLDSLRTVPKSNDKCNLSASLPEEVKENYSTKDNMTSALTSNTQSSNNGAVVVPQSSLSLDQSDIKDFKENGTTFKLEEQQCQNAVTSSVNKDADENKESCKSEILLKINEPHCPSNFQNSDVADQPPSNNKIEKINEHFKETDINSQNMDTNSEEKDITLQETDIHSTEVDVTSLEIGVNTQEIDVDSIEECDDSHEVDICFEKGEEKTVTSSQINELSSEEMDLSSQEIDVVGDITQESGSSGTRLEINEVSSQSIGSPLDVVNSVEQADEDSSDLQSCSTDSQEFQSEAEDTESESLYLSNKVVDDEITLIEVTKKETAPLAVIDLLSDEEEVRDEQKNMSGSEDDIEIVEVCDKSPVKKIKLPPFSVVNFSKLNSKKLQSFKSEQTNQQNQIATRPMMQFPYCLQKDLVCIPRPPLHLLPLHVQPNKEVYILDRTKKQSHQSSERSSRPTPRVWNSFRDMQEYQRSRRQRHSNSRQGMNSKPWPFQNFGNYNNGSGFSRDLQRPYSFNNLSESHSFRRNRNNGRDYDLSRTDDSNISIGVSNQESKPILPSPSPVIGNFPSQRNPLGNSTNPFSFPRFPNPFNSMVNGRHGSTDTFNNFGHNNPMSYIPPSMANVPNFAAEVQRTARNMLASMFGTANLPLPNLFNQPSFETMSSPSHSSQTNHWNGNNNYKEAGGNNYPRDRPEGAFPGGYRYLNNRRSWNEVSAVVEPNKDVSEDCNDVEEIPINVNEYLWDSNICPLVTPGHRHPVSFVLKNLQLVKLAQMTARSMGKEKYDPDTPSLEISFDVYLPGANFKKSCPGLPKYRIIVIKLSDPIPKYSEIAFLKKQFNDEATLQIGFVDNGDISFCSFNSICLPEV